MQDNNIGVGYMPPRTPLKSFVTHIYDTIAMYCTSDNSFMLMDFKGFQDKGMYSLTYNICDSRPQRY